MPGIAMQGVLAQRINNPNKERNKTRKILSLKVCFIQLIPTFVLSKT